MQKTLLIIGLCTLAACATPRQQCETDATKNVKALERAVADAQANIDRGYALERDVSPQFRYGFCNKGGNLTTCIRNDARVKTKPVAIDLAEERRKLASAQQRLTTERTRANTQLAQCATQYPK